MAQNLDMNKHILVAAKDIGKAKALALVEPLHPGRFQRKLRDLVMLLVTGVVIELALMPIGLFHFHQSGVYGALHMPMEMFLHATKLKMRHVPTTGGGPAITAVPSRPGRSPESSMFR